jgi:superfamily II DNA or RNA helicase
MKLYDHQRKILIEDPPKAGLFLGTGSGKTRIALLLARVSILVIAPKTQVEDENWQRELQALGKEALVTEMMVISKETFRRDHTTLPAFNTVIVDEAHTCLGATPALRWVNKVPRPKTSQLFEALQTYIERTNPERFYLCTATIMRNAMTVWAAGVLLGKKWDWYKFRSIFYAPVPMPHGEIWMQKNSSEIKDRLAQCVRDLGYVGRLEDFFDVPEQTFKDIHIALTDKQKARIKEVMLEYPEPLVRNGKIHQIENGILAADEFSKAEEIENGKIDAILDLAAEFPRMVVFAKYRAQITAIQHALADEKYFTWVLTGDTKERGEVIKQANELDGVLIVQAQISAGWETPQTPVVVFASRTHSFVDYDQALGRVQRANAIKKNLYINLITKPDYIGTGRSRVKIGGVDEAQDASLKNKQDFNERIYAETL